MLASKQTNRGHGTQVQWQHEEQKNNNNQGMKDTKKSAYIEHIYYYCKHTRTHTQITQSLREAAHPDKTGSLRAIYDHLMHNEPPISGCVGREMRCGVFPIQLHANTLTITSSTTSGHLHTAAHNLPERHKETDFMGRWNRHFVPKAPVCGCADENKRENE